MRIQSFRCLIAMAGVLLLAGCAETKLASTWIKQASWPGQKESRGVYKVGNPYKVGSVWYYPEENFQLVETGLASWYGPGFHRDHTANGEVFDQNELTAAHRTLQLPSFVRVTNLENGRSVVVRVNDRGPFKHGRVMDVSMRAAQLLGFENKGTARVRLEVLTRESRMLAEAGRRGEDTTHMTVADLQQQPEGTRQEFAEQRAPVASPAMSVKMASRDTGVVDDAMPESLRTPTITVEELSTPGASAAVASEPSSYQPPVRQAAPAYQEPRSVASSGLTTGHFKKGKFLPDPVVSKEVVRPTGLFVQAGSFSVYSNAEGLSKKLAKFAKTTIEPVSAGGRKLYRVKLGPIATVSEADHILKKVISISGGAKVVRN